MKSLIIFFLVLIFSLTTSICQWNMVYKDINTKGGLGSQWDLKCADSLNCISVASRGVDTRLVKTTDGGKSWFIVFEDLQEEVYNEQGQVLYVKPTKYNGARCIDYITPNFVVVGHRWGQITISRDGGFTWDSTNLNTQDFKILKFTDTLSGIALTNNNIFITTDGGDTWNNITNNINHSNSIIFQSAFMKDDFIFAGGFFSNDRGKTWAKSNSQNNISGMYDVYFINNLEGWCIGRKQISNQFYSHVILHTTDGGKNFETQLDTSTIEAPNGLIGGILFINEMDGISWGDNVVWRTNDGGENWNRDEVALDEMNDHFLKMAFPNKNFTKRIANTYFAGEIWLYEDLTSVNENNIKFDDVNIFPNPSSDFITIQLSNKGLQPFVTSEKVQIFDVLGIEVMSESIHPMTASHRMNVENLQAGVYFIRIGNKVEKFVKM